MELLIDFRTDITLPAHFKNIIADVALEALRLAEAGDNYEISVSVVDDSEIRVINRHFRKIDNETDVLSFPLFDFTDGHAVSNNNICVSEEKITTEPLGDIIISAQRIFLQAEQYGHSPEREIGFLTAHGMLHLLGYDHLSAAEEKVMFNLQEQIMRSLNLSR